MQVSDEMLRRKCKRGNREKAAAEASVDKEFITITMDRQFPKLNLITKEKINNNESAINPKKESQQTPRGQCIPIPNFNRLKENRERLQQLKDKKEEVPIPNFNRLKENRERLRQLKQLDIEIVKKKLLAAQKESKTDKEPLKLTNSYDARGFEIIRNKRLNPRTQIDISC
ncbi:MAG: hypothetical protein AAF443_01290 [Chlamydiota bacterium]